jgi:hypothetical protein
MILLLLSIEAAECNVWCISENYDKGSYNKVLTQCECIELYDYYLTKIKKKQTIKKSEQSKPEEAYEEFEYSPYLKIK